MSKKMWSGIVRHYRTPRSRHRPYRGILKAEDDVSVVDRHAGNFSLSLQRMLEDLPDGHTVTISVSDEGPAEAAQGHVYMLTKPNTYERVPLSQWQETLDPADVSA